MWLLAAAQVKNVGGHEDLLASMVELCMRWVVLYCAMLCYAVLCCPMPCYADVLGCAMLMC